jgi:ribosomal protein S18 acetylase RimI-like enzyme
MSRYRWVEHEGVRLSAIGVDPDGTLHNPNGYPEALVRAAVAAAESRHRAWRVRCAKKAAETRRRRHLLRVDAVARQLVTSGRTGPSARCVICRKQLDDADSVRRGIGSECWQQVLTAIEQSRAANEAARSDGGAMTTAK